MTNYNHKITISTYWASIRSLLEHIRYSDSRIKKITLVPDELKPENFVVTLYYKGSKKGWETVKKRAESIGLVIEEG